MERIEKHRINVGLKALAILVTGLLFLSYAPAPAAAAERDDAQALVDRARVTFKEFMRDPIYGWLHENVDRAKGVLIFPQVLKGGFVLGGSGGTGVFLVRDEKTGNWSEPAFYTVGSITFGLQIGGEAAEVVMLAMTQKAVDSLLSTSFKLGGDVSVALGPIGGGAKAKADIPSVTGDFISFAKSKGLYAGLNLEGSVVAVRDSLNSAYYGKDIRPADIIVKQDVSNMHSGELRESLKCKC
ncbi:MAG: lipid-binding SYLF domain-containing protein [Thermodesulfobacteriota bacterium]